jgi:NADPH:quinone reductase-like Zn-dependent oxidoreductase
MSETGNDVQAVVYDNYGEPEVLQLRRIPAPKPGPGDLVIDVHAASVNPIDWKVRSGMLQKFFPMTFPAITGRDGSGVVVAAGTDADASLVGKRVCFLATRGVGTWAERIALPVSAAAPVPTNLTFEQAAALPLAGLSAWAGIVTAANVTAGMRVLIHAAAGGVGSMAVQIARHHGAHVIATCSERNVEFVRRLGAQQVIAYDKVAFENEVKDVDVVFDTMGGDIHKRSYQVLKPGGILTYLSAAPFENQGTAFGVEVKPANVLPDKAALSDVVELAATGKLKTTIEVLPFTDFAKAQEHSQRGHARGKTVLRLRS